MRPPACFPSAHRWIPVVATLLVLGAGGCVNRVQKPIAVTETVMTVPAPVAPAAPVPSPVPVVAPPAPPVAVAPSPAPAPVPAVRPPPAALAAVPRPAADGEVFGHTKLHQVRFEIGASEWAVLQTSSARGGGGIKGSDYIQADGRPVHIGSGFGGFFPWAHIDVTLDGEEFKNVGLRYRGNGSFSNSSGYAPFRANFKLKLDVFGTKGSWQGEKSFNFNAGTVDTSNIREAAAFALFRRAGVPAPRTAYAQVTFNIPGLYKEAPGGYVYTLIENVGGRFLKNALPPGDGLLMKPEGTRGGIQVQGNGSWESYASVFYPDREATPHERQRIMEFCQLISQTDVALFRARVGSYLDVEEFLRFIAVYAFIQNGDSYLRGGHNYYFYLDPKDDKFRFIPWDQDISMGSGGGGGMFGGADFLAPWNGDQPLIYWLFDDPAVSARYRAILAELSATVFTRAELGKLVDELESVAGRHGYSPRSFLDARAAQLERLVASWSQPKDPPAATGTAP
jgi:spore coat protein H